MFYCIYFKNLNKNSLLLVYFRALTNDFLMRKCKKAKVLHLCDKFKQDMTELKLNQYYQYLK